MSTSYLARKSLDQGAEQGPHAEEVSWLPELPVPQEAEFTIYNIVTTNLKYYYWGGIEIGTRQTQETEQSQLQELLSFLLRLSYLSGGRAKIF